MVFGLFSGATLAIRCQSKTPLCLDEWNHPTPVLAIELDPNYSGEAHFNRPGIGPENECATLLALRDNL